MKIIKISRGFSWTSYKKVEEIRNSKLTNEIKVFATMSKIY